MVNIMEGARLGISWSSQDVMNCIGLRKSGKVGQDEF
jgi:hypothetical protein